MAKSTLYSNKFQLDMSLRVVIGGDGYMLNYKPLP